MNVISILIGLLLAVVVYVVGTAVTHFAHADLIWGLVAVIIFIAVAFGDVRGRYGARV
jgi:hypothetical protein